jgi:hypothetical protein
MMRDDGPFCPRGLTASSTMRVAGALELDRQFRPGFGDELPVRAPCPLPAANQLFGDECLF